MRGFALSTVVLAAMSNTGPGTHAEEARREITTSGQAVVHVVPDEVLVIAGVDTFHAQLDRAKQDNDALSQRVLKVVEALGVEAGDIKTSSLFVDMEYNVRDDPAKGIEGYHARRSYSILLVTHGAWRRSSTPFSRRVTTRPLPRGRPTLASRRCPAAASK
jgi:uncharacterized protein YggE